MDPDDVMSRDHERQQMVHAAVEAADRVLMEAADGHEGTLQYITYEFSIYLLDLFNYPLGRSIEFIESDISVYKAAVMKINAIIFKDDTSAMSMSALHMYLWSRVIKSFIDKAFAHYETDLTRWDFEHEK